MIQRNEWPVDGQVCYDASAGMIAAVLPAPEGQTSHAPTLLELPNGDLLCAWFAGSYEGSADVSIVCSRLARGAEQWETAAIVSGDPKRSEQNPSLFLAPGGEVWVMYTAQLDRVPGKDNMQYTSVIRRQRSLDGGRTWSAAETVFPREGSFCRQPIQVLSSGRWIFPNWLCTDSPEGLAGDPTVFQVSDDQGATWHQVMMPDSRGRVHANIVELEGGHLAAFMRSRAADYIYRSESVDNGETWSAPVPTELPNNNSSISAIRLKSGRVAIAYNPTHAPNPRPERAAWPGLRCPVAVALSEDGGITWPMIRYVEAGEGFAGRENATNNRQYEYPFLIQGRDDRLHLAYAWKNRQGIKWISFTEKDVEGERRETQGVYNPTSAQR